MNKPFDDFERQALKAQVERLQLKVRTLREEIAGLKAERTKRKAKNATVKHDISNV
jgi:hypothetical protein